MERGWRIALSIAAGIAAVGYFVTIVALFGRYAEVAFVLTLLGGLVGVFTYTMLPERR